jgi:tRNA (adenine37-N6)-methyltransferase
MNVEPIGYVQGSRERPTDDEWGGAQACIALTDEFTADALQGLAAFSHVEVLFVFHQLSPAEIVRGTRHPRGNPAWPAVGIFAQRGRSRPNRLGSTLCRVLRVEGTRLWVEELDAIEGTPVLDLKPVMVEFLPREAVRQPAWSHELMRRYWAREP